MLDFTVDDRLAGFLSIWGLFISQTERKTPLWLFIVKIPFLSDLLFRVSIALSINSKFYDLFAVRQITHCEGRAEKLSREEGGIV